MAGKAAGGRPALPLVVVGASAGGLEAFRRLLSALPPESGIAFILVPHLDPSRESHMVELLAGGSAMPVSTAQNGRMVRPNHVYVIPPNRLLEVRRGRLVLRPLPHPRAGSTALDFALRSLAEDQGVNAVGIVLSGTGSHGSEGLKAVVRAGGLALVQDPATALYEQMPRAAVAIGVPRRHILAPESMAAVLLAHTRRLPPGGVAARLSLGVSAVFFRDAGALDVLAAEAIPDLVDGATAARPVRVWVPECGTGAEAYSIAMLLLERLGAAGSQTQLKVFATDVDAEALKQARLGAYAESIAETVSPERLTRFFNLLPSRQYQVSSELRETVVFGRLDLAHDPPISKLDLLVYRPQSQSPEYGSLVSRLNFALNPGGYLLLGPDAPAAAFSGMFEAISEKYPLYRKIGVVTHPRNRESAAATQVGAERRRVPRHAPCQGDAEFMNQALLQRLAPAAILMNVRYRILATRGPVMKYLHIPPRMPLPSLLTAAGASLRAATESACEEAMRNHRWARHGGSWRHAGRSLRCSISARSLRSRSSGEPLLLVIFEDDGAGHRSPPGAHVGAGSKRRGAGRGPLASADASRSNLQAVLSELEHANDDLEASNAQMSAMNEELRSANEELQSSNEEMHAINEELESSKASLQERTEAGERLEAQLRAVLDATADAVVTINTDGKIVTFNGSACRTFGYACNEVIGRNVNMLMPPEQRVLHDEYLARYRKTRERHAIGTSREVVAYRRDGSRFPALLSISKTVDADLLVGCIRDLTADKVLQEEILHIATLEQQRIGQELHDGTQQELTGLGLLAQNLAEDLQDADPAKAVLAKRLAAGIAEANRHVRALARGLVPIPIDAETLPAALGQLARSTQETHEISCRFDCPVPVKMPDAATATHLYRIAQEAVGNAAKHARAKDVLIRLAKEDNRLRLEIHDDGIGIPEKPVASGGVGLRLMEHRCTAIGGSFKVERRTGGGTVVSCTVPFLAGS